MKLSSIKMNNLGKFETATEEEVELDACPKCGGTDASSVEEKDTFICSNCKSIYKTMELGYVTYVEEDNIQFEKFDTTIDLENLYKCFLSNLVIEPINENTLKDIRTVFFNGLFHMLTMFKPILYLGPEKGSKEIHELAKQAYLVSLGKKELSKEDLKFVEEVINADSTFKRNMNEVLNKANIPPNPQNN